MNTLFNSQVKELFDEISFCEVSEEAEEVDILRKERERLIQEVVEFGDLTGARTAMIRWLHKFIVQMDLVECQS